MGGCGLGGVWDYFPLPDDIASMHAGNWVWSLYCEIETNPMKDKIICMLAVKSEVKLWEKNTCYEVCVILSLQSLQMCLFLYTVCHVVVVVMDTIDPSDVMFRFLWTVEQMKPYSLKDLGPEVAVG